MSLKTTTTSVTTYDGRVFQLGDRVKGELGHVGTIEVLESTTVAQVQWSVGSAWCYLADLELVSHRVNGHRRAKE